MDLRNNHDWHAALGQLVADPSKEAFEPVMHLFLRSMTPEQQSELHTYFVMACGGIIGDNDSFRAQSQQSTNIQTAPLVNNRRQPAILAVINNHHCQLSFNPSQPMNYRRALAPDTTRTVETQPDSQHPPSSQTQTVSARESETEARHFEQAALALLAACADVAPDVEGTTDGENAQERSAFMQNFERAGRVHTAHADNGDEEWHAELERELLGTPLASQYQYQKDYRG